MLLRSNKETNRENTGAVYVVLFEKTISFQRHESNGMSFERARDIVLVKRIYETGLKFAIKLNDKREAESLSCVVARNFSFSGAFK